jgi:hypothetical protein
MVAFLRSARLVTKPVGMAVSVGGAGWVGVLGTSVVATTACVATGALEPHAVVVIRIIMNTTNNDFIILLCIAFSSCRFDCKKLLIGQKKFT